MNPERAFRRLLTSNLPSPDFRFTPIESRGVVDGVPDVYWAATVPQASGWMEFKVTQGWRVDLRPHQISWLQRHAKIGVRATIAVRQVGVGKDGVPRDVCWLIAGHRAAALAAEGLPQGLHANAAPGVLARLTGGPRQWSYSALAAALTA